MEKITEKQLAKEIKYKLRQMAREYEDSRNHCYGFSNSNFEIILKINKKQINRQNGKI